ncbi:N-acetyltransferase 16, like isoform X6 [Brienomyrus brachyistius]|nr:N-acetyltransferase 16, like isoform X6 [Brienomyrus brachyistius]XP_048884682.1 N-acetyltransferase 16, like isoform X6 [Brienomyrus brachyistius]
MLRCQVIIRFTDQYIRQLYPNVRMRRWAWRVDPGPEKLAKFSLLTCAQVLIPKVVCHAAGNQRVLHTYTIHSRLKGVWTYLINKRKLCLYAMKGGKIGESGGLTFWLASPGDYDDVMAISDGIYEGNDYLPHRYHSWMTEPHRLVILAKRDGKLVALESGLIVDGGSTVVVEGLRVCPSERGRGLAGVIIRFADQYIRQLYPNVRMRRWAWREDPGPEKLAKFSLLTCAQVLIPKVVCHAAGNQRVLHTYTIRSRFKGVWTYLINKRKLYLYAMKGGKIGESGGLTFWLASPGDYDDVMAISDGIYGGNDYLPHRYHSWMTEPHRLVILAKRDGKLVALESGLIVDGGSTVVVEGLRVCPSERGRGLAGVIIRFADQYIRQLYPNVRMRRWAWRVDPGPEKLAKVSLLTKRAILSLQIEAKAFDAFLSTLRAKLEHEKGTGSLDQEFRLVVLEEEQLRHILLDPGVSSQIELPGDVIIQNWQPLKLLESNLEVLQRRNLTWLADSLEKPTFLSLHTPPYPIPYKGGSFYFSIDLFGTKPDLAYRALLAHMEMVRGEIRCMVLMRIYMHQSLWGRLRAFCECSAGVEVCNGYLEQLILEHKL